MSLEALNKYRAFVDDFVNLHKNATDLPIGEFHERPINISSANLVMLFSPHPDDECVVGALPLRLKNELNLPIINVAVTLGSNAGRKNGRLEELTGACHSLGFELLIPKPGALDGVSLKSKETNPENWSSNLDIVKNILKKHRPKFIFFPHEVDFNSTHIGVSHLLKEAIVACAQADWQPVIFETEFWHMMSDPNLMIGLKNEDEALLIYALSCHSGEVERNPYHINHPARMLDNVTRGSEVVGGQGGEGAEMNFAMLYRCSKFVNGKFERAYEGGKIYAPSQDLNELLTL
jgi:N-acetylglucosamine malate deacetylase 1